MTSIPTLLQRGCVFRAEHDASYEFWKSPDARWKLCLAFNSIPADTTSDVHYFIATSKLTYFRENPHLLSEVLIVPPNLYSFFPEETAIDFRDLHVVPFSKLQSNGLRVLGHLTPGDIQRCEATIRAARLLSNRDRRRLNLLD
ncbi:MAG TPA: hypothetical protein VGQ21_18430 [Thermoanaerobaculia bacterium]|jgi:hypothetical protein|nr:hypothetical protein [Thermoanaerobaculia bacterium]